MSRLRAIFLAVLMVVATIPVATAFARTTLPDSLSRSYRHTEAIKALTIREDTLSARRIWLDIVKEDSTYAPAYYYLSHIERDSDQGVRYAHRAFASDSTNKWYTQNYADRLVASGRYTRAIPIFRRLMRLDPNNLQSYHALAVLYGINGMPYSAIAILDSAELRLGYNYYLADIKQELLLSTRQYDRAMQEGERRIKEHPYDAEGFTKLANIYDVAGRDSLARVTYDRAFKLDTTNTETIIIIADYYSRKGNVTRMLDYEQYLFRSDRVDIQTKLSRVEDYTSNRNIYADFYPRIGGIIRQMAIDYPNNRAVVDIYSQHLILGGYHSEALEYLRRHLEDEGVTDEDYLYVVQLEHYMGMEELVQQEIIRALELFPKSVNLLSFYSYLLSEQGDYDRAIWVLRAALDGATDDVTKSSIIGNIGDMYHEKGSYKEAFRHYKRALSFNSDNALVLNNYAYFLSLRNEDLEKALRMAERAVELQPNNASYVDTKAWVLHTMGRNEEAKQVMRQALSLSSMQDASLLMHYGDILWSLGEKFMAETYWQKAVERGYDKELMEAHIQIIKRSK